MKKIVRGFSSVLLACLLVSISGQAGHAQERTQVFDTASFTKGTIAAPSLHGVSAFPVESFEGAFLPAGWSKITNFGGIGWQQVAADSNVLGFTAPAPADAPTGGGNFVAFSSWATGDADGDFNTGQATDQWLITPKIANVQTGDTLKFYLRYFAQFGDNLDVKISTTNADSVESFTINVATISFSGPGNNAWRVYKYVLTDFVAAGSDIYIAFRERVTDTSVNGDALLLDLVEVISLVTSVNDRSDQIPEAFVLQQNYPNPFNPSTRISFNLPVETRVTLQVYNLLGQVVATLADGERFSAGVHSVDFRAGELPNGLYFYQIRAGVFSQVRRMTLLK